MHKLMSIKMYMRIKMKNILIFALLLVFGKTAGANMVLAAFELNGASSDRKFMVNNLHAPTSVEFRFNLMKYSDPSSPGDCHVTLLYTESPENNNYDSHPSTIEISPTKHVLKSEFASHGTIYQSVWLPAVLPAYKFAGKIVIRYRFFHSAQNKEVSVYSTTKYDLTTPQSTISNDNYTGAIELSSVAIAGSTQGATYSPQERPSCYSPSPYSMTKDIWYKFVATSSNHTLKIENVHFQGNTMGTPSVARALYNSSLNVLGCFYNNTATFSNLTIGETYFIRCWAANGNPQMTMNFNISLVANGANTISGTREGTKLTVSYTLDPSIPVSDITFEWEVWPGEVEPASNYSIEQGAGPHQIYIIPGENEGDTTVRARVRMKRISTNEPLTDWYIYSSLIWF